MKYFVFILIELVQKMKQWVFFPVMSKLYVHKRIGYYNIYTIVTLFHAFYAIYVW